MTDSFLGVMDCSMVKCVGWRRAGRGNMDGKDFDRTRHL